MFVKHPAVSMMVQVLGLPGKSGKARSRLGVVERDDETGAIHLPVSDYNLQGTVSARISPDPSFDFRRFRRSLQHIALNAYASAMGAAGLEERFDAVRQYVREPKHREAWSILHYVDARRAYSLRGTVRFDRVGAGFYVGILLSPGLAFAVDLMNSGGLRDWAPSRFQNGFEFYSSTDHVPAGPKIKGRVRTRLTLGP
jgi:hypothetical protein